MVDGETSRRGGGFVGLLLIVSVVLMGAFCFLALF
jgi:hypothetical protein